MTPILLNNTLHLVDNNDNITMTITVPRLNLKRLCELTKCTILYKESTILYFNHNAGETFKVTILVRFKNIEKYLEKSSIRGCVNADIYLGLFYSKYAKEYYTNVMAYSDTVRLYAFGDCSSLNHSLAYPSNIIYYNLLGHKISLVTTPENNFGKKRYINFKGHVYSNKQF